MLFIYFFGEGGCLLLEQHYTGLFKVTIKVTMTPSLGSLSSVCADISFFCLLFGASVAIVFGVGNGFSKVFIYLFF
jgi:hypothetical protein